MGNPCHQPPGRIWAVTNFLPEIPRPIWDRYVNSGKFPRGIQAGLDETAACQWVSDMAQVRAQAVVVDGTQVSADIRGAFPWGWYRRPWSENAPPPPPPREAARFVQAIARVSVDQGLQLDPLLGVPVNTEASCSVQSVPSIDLLAPYPLNNGAARFREGQRSLLAGDLGRLVVRLPGSAHPMFSTGLGVVYIVKRYLSPLGIELFDFWDRVRMTTGLMTPDGQPVDRRYEELSYVWPIFSSLDVTNMLPLAWWTRDFSHTHMQCLARNCYPDTEGHRGLGLAGKPISTWRWQGGGSTPAAYMMDGWDAYGEAVQVDSAIGSDNVPHAVLSPRVNYAWPTGLDAMGKPYAEGAPEAPFGYVNRWEGRRRINGTWSGPSPGALLA